MSQKHNLVLRKETSKQGYFIYKVVDPATGRVIAKRTATRHFVAALFQWDESQVKARKIANCFGRMDLIQTTMTKDKEWTAGEVDQLLQGIVVKGYMLATIDPAEVNLNMTIEATTETEAWKQKAKTAEKELKELQEEHEALKEQVAELEYQGEEDRKTIARQAGRVINLERNSEGVGFKTLKEAQEALEEAATSEDDNERLQLTHMWLVNLAFAHDLQWDDNYHQALFQRAADLLRDDNMMTSDVLRMQMKNDEPEDTLEEQNRQFIDRRRATLREDIRELYDAGHLDYLTD